MVLDHMRRICGRHSFALGHAFLPGFEIGLDLRGYANIRPASGQSVHGVLFEIDEEALVALDKFEGYPDVFGRKKVIIQGNNNTDREAWVYFEPADQFGGNQPRVEYFNRVISGARENHLPESWINKLQDLVRQSCT